MRAAFRIVASAAAFFLLSISWNPVSARAPLALEDGALGGKSPALMLKYDKREFCPFCLCCAIRFGIVFLVVSLVVSDALLPCLDYQGASRGPAAGAVVYDHRKLSINDQCRGCSNPSSHGKYVQCKKVPCYPKSGSKSNRKRIRYRYPRCTGCRDPRNRFIFRRCKRRLCYTQKGKFLQLL